VADDKSKDEKTEEASAHRLQEARSEGQVAMSTELVAALMLSTGIVALIIGRDQIGNTLGITITEVINSLGDTAMEELTTKNAAAILGHSLGTAIKLVGVLFLPVVGVGVVVSYAQIGFQFAPKAVAPDITKFDPIKGSKRLFSMRSWVRTGMSLVKIIAISGSMIAMAWAQLPAVIHSGTNEIGPLLPIIGTVILRCTLAAVAMMLLIAVIDLIYQRFQHAKDMRMTKDEVKQENKSTEGDPQVKARVRALQREASQKRMMADVPDATVVVTNPTHYAVALSYPRDAHGEPTSGAPKVVAKGFDHVAQQIKKVAGEAGVTLYEDVPLARALHAQVEIGDEIPESLYSAVAAVLNYVYSLEGSRLAAG
jgi:flagellar biosynthetic protein FlhB